RRVTPPGLPSFKLACSEQHQGTGLLGGDAGLAQLRGDVRRLGAGVEDHPRRLDGEDVRHRIRQARGADIDGDHVDGLGNIPQAPVGLEAADLVLTGGNGKNTVVIIRQHSLGLMGGAVGGVGGAENRDVQHGALLPASVGVADHRCSVFFLSRTERDSAGTTAGVPWSKGHSPEKHEVAMRVIVPAVLFLSVSLALLVGGCASAPAKETAEQVTLFEKDAPDVTIPESLGSPRVRSWRAVDDRTLIIEASGHGELVATFTTPCRGIRFAETLGFATLGPFELDKST